MQKSKRSPIHLDTVSLRSVSFKARATKLGRIEIPASSLKITVSIEEESETSFRSTTNILIYGDNDPRGEFEMQLSYLVVASIAEVSHKDELEKFARFGAPFNALVYARETVASLTAKTFGRSAIVPLLDIRELGKELTIQRAPKPFIGSSDDNQTVTSPDQNPQ